MKITWLFAAFLTVLSLSVGFLMACHRPVRPHDRAQLHNNQGIVYQQRREFDKALKEFQIAIELSPDYADAFHNLGALYEQTGDLNRAEQNYLLSIKRDSKFSPPHNGLCSVYIRRGQYEKAIEQAKKALKLDPASEDAAYNMGLAYARKKENPEALKAFRLATDINPNSYLSHNEMGKVYLVDGKYEEAIIRFKVALEVNANFSDAWKNLAFAQYQTGDLAKALQAAKASVTSDPKSAAARKILAAIYLKQSTREPLNAQAHCEEAAKALDFSLKNISAFDGEALINFALAERCVGGSLRKAGQSGVAQGWLQQAEKSLLKAIEVEPETCISYLHLGELRYDDLEKKDAGLKSFEEALQCCEKSGKRDKVLGLTLFKLGTYGVEKGDRANGKKYLCRFLALPPIEKDPNNEQFRARAKAYLKDMGGC